jgi:hypothetical protein
MVQVSLNPRQFLDYPMQQNIHIQIQNSLIPSNESLLIKINTTQG